MSGPETVRLYFAVLDGFDPTTWTLYGKTFPKLMEDVCDAARPEDVSADLLEDYHVQVEPILSGPQELLEENALDGVVGVIIARPSPHILPAEHLFQARPGVIDGCEGSQILGGCTRQDAAWSRNSR